MPGLLLHSPADIVRNLLVSLGLGTYPTDPPGTWPIYATVEPSLPDNCITVFDTGSTSSGRIHTSGEQQEHHGIQIRIRSTTHIVGYPRARALAIAIDENIYQEVVAIENTTYLVHCINRVGDVISLGKEVPTTKRNLYTINAMVSVRTVS
jgi:hypothetical protein